MKYKLLIFNVLIIILYTIACKKEPVQVAPTTQNLTLHFDNKVGQESIVLKTKKYSLPSGTGFWVGALRYYVSNVTLIKKDGATVEYPLHQLIKTEDAPTQDVLLKAVPVGDYTQIQFHIGVDDKHNMTGAQTGDLDPLSGMFWTWNTGYIFFKHEGRFVKTDKTEEVLVHHYGNASAYVNIELTNQFSLTNAAKKATIALDLNTLYSSPNIIDFNEDYSRQSLTKDDLDWVVRMKENLSTAFKVSKIE